MKAVHNRLHLFTFILFALGVLLSAYQLFNFGDALQQSSIKIDFNVIKTIHPVLFQTQIIIGITLLLGVSVAMLYYFGNLKSEAKEKIVYVEKEQKTEQEPSEGETAIAQDIQTLLDEIIQKVRTEKDVKKKATKILSILCQKMEACQGALFQMKKERSRRSMVLTGGYALSLAESMHLEYEFGEGLVGQAAKDGKIVNIDEIPEGHIKVVSGLGTASPTHLIIVPLLVDTMVLAVAEIAGFKKFTEKDEQLIGKSLELLSRDLSVEKSAVKKKKALDNK